MTKIIVINLIIVDECVDEIIPFAVLILNVVPQVVSSRVESEAAGCRTLVAFLNDVTSHVLDQLRYKTCFFLFYAIKLNHTLIFQ